MDLRLMIILAVLALVAGLVVGQLLRRQLEGARAEGGVLARLRKRARRRLIDLAVRWGWDRGGEKRGEKRRDSGGQR